MGLLDRGILTGLRYSHCLKGFDWGAIGILGEEDSHGSHLLFHLDMDRMLPAATTSAATAASGGSAATAAGG